LRGSDPRRLRGSDPVPRLMPTLRWF
jgi:hypothetical protein